VYLKHYPGRGFVRVSNSPPNFASAARQSQRGLGGLWAFLTDTGPLFEASADVSGQSALTPDWWYELHGKPSPDQIIAANAEADAQAKQATIDPLTGQPVPAAVAYASKTQGAAGAALVAGQAQDIGDVLGGGSSGIPLWVWLGAAGLGVLLVVVLIET
jgi:hypothetical protein